MKSADILDTIYVIPVQVRKMIEELQNKRMVQRACDVQVIDKKQISKILVRHISAG